MRYESAQVIRGERIKISTTIDLINEFADMT